MKQTKTLLLVMAAILLAAAVTTGCKGKSAAPQSEPQNAEATETSESQYMKAIERFLSDEIGSQLAPGEVCIPVYSVVGKDEYGKYSESGGTIADTIRVWGDWWVFKYNISGDTLLCVSGGNYPGMFCMAKEDKAYEVVAFDQVVDGAGNQASAQRIFGDKYDTFQSVNGNQQTRDSVRTAMTADYVRTHGLKVTMYKDFGWPAVQLPIE